MTVQKFDVKEVDVFKLLEYSERSKKLSDKALNNKIVPFPGFDETEFNEDIWYEIKKEKYGQSYTLYIHTLRICVELLLEYENSNRKEYYDKAKEIIFSWLKFSEEPTDNKMIWYDHTTANRTQALIHFIFISENIGEQLDYELFKNTLQKHGEVLMNDKLHKLNNHGLMMDRSLMVLGNVLNDDNYKQKGVARALNTFWFNFSHKGVHLENSPQYHNMVLRMYEEIEMYLNNRDESLGNHILEYMKLAKEYSALIVRPNKKITSIGDTGNSYKKIKKKYSSIYDREAGISIIQQESPTPLFLTYICGYSTKVHKHKDDLSITLNYNKKDFFVDPGPYNYSKHKIRKYMISKEAHSSFYLKEFDYNIKESNRYTRKISLEHYFESSDYYIVRGYNGDYTGSSAKLSRTVIVFKDSNLIILIDDVDTSVKHKLRFTQNFNLDRNVKVDKLESKINLNVDEETLSVKQFNDIDSFKVVKGDKNKPVALNTTGFGKATETNQLQFEYATNEESVFMTAIYDEKLVGNLYLLRANDIINIAFNNKNYTVAL